MTLFTIKKKVRGNKRSKKKIWNKKKRGKKKRQEKEKEKKKELLIWIDRKYKRL